MSDGDAWDQDKPHLFLPLGPPPIPRWFLADPNRVWWFLWFAIGNGVVSVVANLIGADLLAVVSMLVGVVFLIFTLVIGMSCIIWSARHYDFAHWFEHEMRDRMETEKKFLLIQKHFDNPYADEDES